MIKKIISIMAKISQILTLDKIKITKKNAALFASDYNWGYTIKYFMVLFWAIPWSLVIGKVFGFTVLYWGFMQFYYIMLLLFILTSKDYYVLPTIYILCAFYFIYTLSDRYITSTYVGYYKTVSFIIANILAALFLLLSRQLKSYKIISHYIDKSNRPANFRYIIFHHMVFCLKVFTIICALFAIFTFIASRPISSSKDYEIEFYNKNFETAVRDELSIDDNVPIMRSDLDSIQAINISHNFVTFGKKYTYNYENWNENDIIFDFNALEKFDGTQHDFNTPLNNIKDLRHFRNLKYLEITANKKLILYNIDDLQSLKNLETLKLTLDSHNTNIKNLKNITSLKCLFLENSKTEDIAYIKNMTNLTTLKLTSSTKLKNIDTLKKCQTIKHLSINNCNITNIDVLSEMKNLTYLSLSKNNVSDLSPIEDLTDMQYLDLRYNDISDIDVIKNLTNLKCLVLLKNNNITDISSLTDLSNLKYLWLEENSNYDFSTLKSKDVQIYTGL